MQFNKKAFWFAVKVNLAAGIFVALVLTILLFILPTNIFTPRATWIVGAFLNVIGYGYATQLLLKNTKDVEKKIAIDYAWYVFLVFWVWGCVDALHTKRNPLSLTLPLFAVEGVAAYIVTRYLRDTKK